MMLKYANFRPGILLLVLSYLFVLTPAGSQSGRSLIEAIQESPARYPLELIIYSLTFDLKDAAFVVSRSRLLLEASAA